jgi:RND family efflux transporter MFP subunit
MAFKKENGIVASFATALTLLLASGCAKKSLEEPAGPETKGRVVGVVPARKTGLKITLTLSGEFKPFQEVDVHAKVAGYIKKIDVDVGDKVTTGQTLAVLEVPELDAQVLEANAALAKARSAHEVAHLAYTRLRKASETRSGLIAPQELDDAQAKDSESEAQIAVAEAEQQRVSVLAFYSRITAPFTGVITKRYADTGALIQAGTSSSTTTLPVVRLAEYDKLRLVLPVPESVAAQIRVGTNVRVRVGALHRTFDGKVARFADNLDRQTRSMETEIDVPNQDGSLIPGMYAEALLELAQNSAALTIPIQAVSRNGAEVTVLLVGAGDKLEERKVTLGLVGTKRVEVLTGLQAGDRIVIGSRSQSRPGEVVRPQPIEEAGDEAEGEL